MEIGAIMTPQDTQVSLKLHIISSKYTSFYEDFPLPNDAADYPSHEELLRYFQGYTDHFDLEKNINLILKSFCSKANHKWKIKWKNLTTNDVKTDIFDALVVCNGHHHGQDFLSTLESFQVIIYILISIKKHCHLKIRKCWLLVEETLLVMLQLKLHAFQKHCNKLEKRLLPNTQIYVWINQRYICFESRWLPRFLRLSFMRFMLELIQGK